MKKKMSLDSLRVRDACTESWNEMAGNDQVRFCSHCAKDVNNISAMTRKQARRLVRRSGGSLCIRYVQHPETKAPIFAEQLTQITRRRAPLMAAGVMSASLSLAGLTYAQGGAVGRVAKPTPVRTETVECEDKGAKNNTPPEPRTVLGDALTSGTDKTAPVKTGSGSVKGIIVDRNGTVVPQFKVTLFKAEVTIQTTTSNDAGEFSFADVPYGEYSIKTDSAAGLAQTVTDVVIGEYERSVVIEVHPVQIQVPVMVGMIVEQPKALRGVSRDLGAIRDMIAMGEDLNQKDDEGSTPIFSAVEDGNLDAVKLLLDHGAKVNVRNDEKETPLMMINEETSLELVELLLERGAKVNRVASNGDTALIRVAGEGRPEVLRALIRAGADLNIQNEDGLTALMSAADNDNLENVRLLLEAGADVNLRDKEGDNAWDHTIEKEVEDLLVSYGVVLDPEDVDLPEEDVPEPAADPKPVDNK